MLSLLITPLIKIGCWWMEVICSLHFFFRLARALLRLNTKKFIWYFYFLVLWHFWGPFKMSLKIFILFFLITKMFWGFDDYKPISLNSKIFRMYLLSTRFLRWILRFQYVRNWLIIICIEKKISCLPKYYRSVNNRWILWVNVLWKTPGVLFKKKTIRKTFK